MSEAGIINIIKPPGMTSFAVVNRVKKLLGIKKAGHTGTLDPAAAGVLPVCVGKGTKVIQYLPEKVKEYIGELTLGIVTDTLDAEGTIISRDEDWQKLSLQEITEVFAGFTGRQEQVPPMYSALHHQGKRLYELAREGKKVKREPRPIEIFEMEILAVELPRIRFRTVCSRGTYIRSLARDIGENLGSGAHLSFLLRTRSGSFSLNNAYTFEEIEQLLARGERSFLLGIDQPLDFPMLVIKDQVYKKAVNGVFLFKEDFVNWQKDLHPGDLVRIYDRKGNFLALHSVTAGGQKCKPERIFI